MIDPVIFKIGSFSLRWYGVIVMIGVVVGSLIVERWLKRHGEKGDRIWDALLWVLLPGILGARLWYVLNATVGGNNYYMENPIQILNIPQGGLHIFGGFLFGLIALLLYLRLNKLDVWLFLDGAGPAALVGQGIGRIANFINQELYGPPTDLPWGIKIEAEHRLPQYQNLLQYPVETTRFHPTFAYEMLWNFAAAGLLLWLSRRYEKDLKPGALFSGWLVLAGLGRLIIEFFRPDQPKIPGLGLTYSAIFSALMAIAGAVLLMLRYKVLNPAFAEDWEDEYQIGEQVEATGEEVESESEFEEPEVAEPMVVKKPRTPRTKKVPAVETDTPVRMKIVRRKPARKTTGTTTSKRTTSPKKTSE